MDKSSYQKNASKEHQDLVEYSSIYFKGNKIKIGGSNLIKGHYFPDVKTEDTDIEVEILPKQYIKKKIDKWDKSRKKILVTGFSKEALDNFDEIYCITKNKEIIKVF